MYKIAMPNCYAEDIRCKVESENDRRGLLELEYAKAEGMIYINDYIAATRCSGCNETVLVKTYDSFEPVALFCPHKYCPSRTVNNKRTIRHYRNEKHKPMVPVEDNDLPF